MGGTFQKGGESMGAPPSSRGCDTSLFGERLRARIAWRSGNAQLEILRSLQLGFRGIYSWDSRLAIQAFLGGRFFLLQEGEKEGARGRAKKGSTVGRLCDLPWVAETTYSRFSRRPTVGLFLGVLKGGL